MRDEARGTRDEAGKKFGVLSSEFEEKIKEGLDAAVAEAAVGPVGGIQILDHLNIGLINLMDHQLGQAVSAAYGIRFSPQVNDRQSDFAPVIGIDGARSVDQADAVFQGQSAAGPYLAFKSNGYGHGQASWDQADFSWREGYFVFNSGRQIQSGGAGAHVSGN